jgi:hypothetical protein
MRWLAADAAAVAVVVELAVRAAVCERAVVGHAAASRGAVVAIVAVVDIAGPAESAAHRRCRDRRIVLRRSIARVVAAAMQAPGQATVICLRQAVDQALGAGPAAVVLLVPGRVLVLVLALVLVRVLARVLVSARDRAGVQLAGICKTTSTFPAVVVGMQVAVGHLLARQVPAEARVWLPPVAHWLVARRRNS